MLCFQDQIFAKHQFFLIFTLIYAQTNVEKKEEHLVTAEVMNACANKLKSTIKLVLHLCI